MARYAAFPYNVHTGLTACATNQEHLSQMIEQVLFVAPGERVNRPQFGCDLRRRTFSARTNELTTALEALVQSALRQVMGDLIQVVSVSVEAQDAEVTVTIRYFDVHTQETWQIQLVH